VRTRKKHSALSWHCASEAGGFRSPIAAHQRHSRSEQDAIEPRPADRPKKHSSTQKTPERAKIAKNSTKNSKTRKNRKKTDKSICRPPKNVFFPPPTYKHYTPLVTGVLQIDREMDVGIPLNKQYTHLVTGILNTSIHKGTPVLHDQVLYGRGIKVAIKIDDWENFWFRRGGRSNSDALREKQCKPRVGNLKLSDLPTLRWLERPLITIDVLMYSMS
jgi:hypothetical protein